MTNVKFVVCLGPVFSLFSTIVFSAYIDNPHLHKNNLNR